MTQSFYTINGRTMTGEQVVMLALTEQERAEAAEARATELAAQLATAQAERDAGCTWKRRYDKQGYPIYDSTCDIASEQGEVEFSGFNFCPYCGKKIAVVLESKP